jgi:mitogen-activated protein kinase kinase kinase
MRGELLGQGSYGRVYLALNATTGEIMAVKQVEFPKTASDRIKPHQLDVMKALKFESDTLKDLDHANIVQYLGYEESEDFLSM